MTEIITYIQANWTAWLFAILGAILGDIIPRLRIQKKESNAIAAGVLPELCKRIHQKDL